jgi:ubiquinone/menaquinone biosynthesis C-methylase UbiE
VRTAASIQQEYYERTAHRYDADHVRDGDEHHVALEHMSGLVDYLGISSILDVGCGTGRGLKYFLRSKRGIIVHGVEPVGVLIERAVNSNSIPADSITEGFGEALPFADESFDAVFECGLLHHVAEPERIVREMMRVSRKAVFLSDENRFAHGNVLSRWAKLALWKTGLFKLAYRLKTWGKGYRFSEGDGPAYSYSAFDSIEMLSEWANRVFVVPTDDIEESGLFHPLMTSFHVLLCAIRDGGREEVMGRVPKCGQDARS